MTGRRVQGFALAAVLWLIAGLSIVVAMVGDAAVSSKQRVAQLRERTDFLQASISARAELVYRLSVSRPTSVGWTDGVTTLRGDGSPYQLGATHLVHLHDAGGLLNLNAFPRQLAASFLANCSIPPDDIDRLLDALEDYVDSDHLSRVNGAERDTYVWAGKPEPRNSPLLSVPELWSVWGWEQHRQTLDANRCTSALAALPVMGPGTSRLNLATAPTPMLKAAGLGAETIDDINRARGDLAALAQRTVPESTPAGPFSGAVFALRTVRVRHRHASGPWQLEYTLALDADGVDRPWTVTQIYTPSDLGNPEGVAKIAPIPWPVEPPAVTTSDVAQFLKL